MAAKIINTPFFRASFPKLFKPEAFEPGQKPKYSVKALFPKDTDLTALKELAREAATEKWGQNVPANMRPLFVDGDTKTKTDGSKIAGYEGMLVCSLTSERRVPIKGADMRDIIDENEIYGGCWMRAAVTAFAYGGPGTKYVPGVAFYMQAIQKYKDDDAFGLSVDPDTQFQPLEVPEVVDSAVFPEATGTPTQATFSQANVMDIFK